MRLRGVLLGNVFNASGARGFAGEGYWFHDLARPFGLSWEDSTLVTKTTTALARRGNMQLDDEDRPRKLFPDCIVVKPRAGVVLNAVGLSGPGVEELKDRWIDELPRAPVVLSIAHANDGLSLEMAVGTFAASLERVVNGRYCTAIQINVSCPNTGEDAGRDVVRQATIFLDGLRSLDVPMMVKVNALTPIERAREIAEHPGCDALVVSNTIPWGQLPERIDWAGLFGSSVSPLARYGGGGLSGTPLLPIVAGWIRKARVAGFDGPIVGGGGILSKSDADVMIDAGASAVELGSVAILRPWRVQGIVRHANRRLDDLWRTAKSRGEFKRFSGAF